MSEPQFPGMKSGPLDPSPAAIARPPSIASIAKQRALDGGELEADLVPPSSQQLNENRRDARGSRAERPTLERRIAASLGTRRDLVGLASVVHMHVVPEDAHRVKLSCPASHHADVLLPDGALCELSRQTSRRVRRLCKSTHTRDVAVQAVRESDKALAIETVVLAAQICTGARDQGVVTSLSSLRKKPRRLVHDKDMVILKEHRQFVTAAVSASCGPPLCQGEEDGANQRGDKAMRPAGSAQGAVCSDQTSRGSRHRRHTAAALETNACKARLGGEGHI
mmetsp:Transcript_79525/g.221270  ORF Transcript_79525/g.221270 Transcript_79525/m.221270 type:complete len:280 (-) Transcript_79525:45-884(-)